MLKFHSRNHHTPNKQSGQTCNFKNKQRMQHDSIKNNYRKKWAKFSNKTMTAAIYIFNKKRQQILFEFLPKSGTSDG